MMPNAGKQTSAFAIYAKKRKNSENITSKVTNSIKKAKISNGKKSFSMKMNKKPSLKVKNSAKSKTKLSKPLKTSKTLQVDNSDDEEVKNTTNPVNESTHLFEWLIHPLQPAKFFKESWENIPVHIQRNKENYYKLLMSTPLIDDILRRCNILYTKNLDITSYSNGQRETHNPPGRAYPSVVWDYYSNGCSVRMLNPQTFIPKLHAMNATLQEFFGCFVGANFYLTPPGSQGFAPHYDDIEAFILQIEGKKRWRLYKPRTDDEILPRFSSGNFQQSEIGEPILDVVVKAGDLLYFPRGTIHQGETLEDSHSLHITLSVYQKNTWGDFLKKLLPNALNSAIVNNPELRRGLPLHCLNNVGLVHKEKSSDSRSKFLELTKDMLKNVIDMIDIDLAADQMAKDHIHDFLPPVLSPNEAECSVLRNGEKMEAEGRVVNRVEIEPDTKIRLSRAHCARLVKEDGDNDEVTYKLYYSCENSKEYHEYELQFLEVDKILAPAVKKIIQVYPEFIKVDDLPIDGEDNRIQVARDLWEKGIVLTDVPLYEVE